MLCGYTWARPVSLEPDKVIGQSYIRLDSAYQDIIDILIFGPKPPEPPNPPTVDVSYTSSSTDPTNNILKYRYEHLIKADVEFVYKKASAGMSFKYYSFMQNVDKAFYADFFTAQGIDAKSYRDANRTPEFVFDFRIAYQFSENSKVSFIINNALNREYALRPLDMSAPRSFAFQYSLTLNGVNKKKEN